MDLGFGAFLEKFEANFGSRLTRGLMLLIGLAVSVICASTIWKLALGPFLGLVVDALDGAGFWGVFVRLGWVFASIVLGFAFASMLGTSFVNWRHTKALKRAYERAEATVKSAEDFTEQASARYNLMMDEAREMADQARLVIGQNKELAAHLQRLETEIDRSSDIRSIQLTSESDNDGDKA